MSTEKHETESQSKHAIANHFEEVKKDIDAERHPEEQIVKPKSDPKLYAPRGKVDLNGPPDNQKV
jgi:hypothetical protein